MSKTGKNYEEIFFKQEKVSKNVICQIKIEQGRLGIVPLNVLSSQSK